MEIVSAEEAVRRLPAQGRIFVAPGCGTPFSLLDALGDARAAFADLEVCTGLLFRSARFLEEVPRPFRLTVTHPTAVTEPLVTGGRADHLPLRYSQTPVIFGRDGLLPVDALLIQVSSPDRDGVCTLGASVSASLDLVAETPLVIAEINRRAPRTAGAEVHISRIAAACEVDAPLAPYEPPVVGEVERQIGRRVAELVPDGACFQIGIGAIPQAILEALSDHRDLGIHSGLVCDGMIPLIERGVVTGARKEVDPGLVVAGEAMGTEPFFRFVDCNQGFRFVSARYSHGLDAMRPLHNFTAINSALEVDLTGQVNAEWVNGRQISGLGGQFDFVEAAMYAPGGRSITALPSTAARGTVSRIVPALAAGTPVTTPRYCVDTVVTEFGVADLRGKGLRERARALTAIAHPAFRDALEGVR